MIHMEKTGRMMENYGIESENPPSPMVCWVDWVYPPKAQRDAIQALVFLKLMLSLKPKLVGGPGPPRPEK